MPVPPRKSSKMPFHPTDPPALPVEVPVLGGLVSGDAGQSTGDGGEMEVTPKAAPHPMASPPVAKGKAPPQSLGQSRQPKFLEPEPEQFDC